MSLEGTVDPDMANAAPFYHEWRGNSLGPKLGLVLMTGLSVVWLVYRLPEFVLLIYGGCAAYFLCLIKADPVWSLSFDEELLRYRAGRKVRSARRGDVARIDIAGNDAESGAIVILTDESRFQMPHHVFPSPDALIAALRANGYPVRETVSLFS